jgi:Zn-dependent peptidase ImmA (M78 family)
VDEPPGLAINPRLIVPAADRVGLGLRDLAERASKRLHQSGLPAVDVDDIAAWASATRRPSLAEAESLAETLLLPFCGLFSSELPPTSVLDFRTAPSRPHEDRANLSYETHARLARFDRFYRLASELVSVLALGEAVTIPTAPRADLRDSQAIEESARRIREAIRLSDDRQLAWSSDDEALADVRSAIEETGAFVFSFALRVDEVRGASRWDRGGPPAILINAADAPPARLFTLLHEFAHLVVSPPSRPFLCDPARTEIGAEVIANRLSAATLVPMSVLNAVLPMDAPHALPYGGWPRQLRASLRKALNVSHPVIGIRLTQLGLASGPGSMKSFWRSGNGFGRGRLSTAERYKGYLGHRTTGLAWQAVNRELMPIGAVSRALELPVHQVEAVLTS